MTFIWRNFVMLPLSWIINIIYQIIPNYGVAIILFTIIIKAILFPFNLKGMKSSMRMQALQPKMKELQEKYKDNRQKLAEEQQKLYKKENISPLAGCLPQIIPLIIMFGIYYVVAQPMTFTLHLSSDQIQSEYYQPLVDAGVQVKDFSYYSTRLQVSLMNLAVDNNIDVPKINFNFLGLNISNTPIDMIGQHNYWYLLFPLLSGITAWFSQKVMMDGMKYMQQPTAKKKKTGVEGKVESMQGSMNSMMKIMPIFTAWIAFQFSAALGLYWIISNLTQLAQQWYINESVRKPHAEKLKEASASK